MNMLSILPYHAVFLVIIQGFFHVTAEVRFGIHSSHCTLRTAWNPNENYRNYGYVHSVTHDGELTVR